MSNGDHYHLCDSNDGLERETSSSGLGGLDAVNRVTRAYGLLPINRIDGTPDVELQSITFVALKADCVAASLHTDDGLSKAALLERALEPPASSYNKGETAQQATTHVHND